MDLESHFRTYGRSFLTGVYDFDRNIELKIDHTFRVLDLAKQIAASAKLSPRLAQLAADAALLHDYGRFEQYKRFETFSDADSVNHGRLGAELATQHRLLSNRPETDREAVISAIRLHNVRELPPALSGDAPTLLKVVRDADKLDIIELILNYHIKHLDNPSVTLGLSLDREITGGVLDALSSGRVPEYGALRTVYDFAATKLAWFRDLNFAWSRRYYIARGFAGTLLNFLEGVKGGETVRKCFNPAIGGENAE